MTRRKPQGVAALLRLALEADTDPTSGPRGPEVEQPDEQPATSGDAFVDRVCRSLGIDPTGVDPATFGIRTQDPTLAVFNPNTVPGANVIPMRTKGHVETIAGTNLPLNSPPSAYPSLAGLNTVGNFDDAA